MLSARGQADSISIHAPREGFVSRRDGSLHISIHAPREGSDLASDYTSAPMRISIHAPREGSDNQPPTAPGISVEFLSTLPARGATVFYRAHLHRLAISIHAPREGSDILPRVPR